ncbi:AraC family ligand binding domain-containing protein [Paenibacillus hemerocallicola]|uniref:AraC family ligand binding domain-containing protein n=1 Tax=Paenibacillus hemerocallicola TaxID=1172614 RepID=UPI00159EC92D|nr:AraC family ligand binding domain-containing protein [Paenibacillus hemerocallicola]
MKTNLPLPLIEQFRHRFERRLRPELHTHPKYEIICVHDGTCNYMIGDRCHRVAAGNLIIMNGMTGHGPFFRDRLPFIRSIVYLDPYCRGLTTIIVPKISSRLKGIAVSFH